MKRITLYVTCIHIFFLLWMALWMPASKKIAQPLQVRTVVVSPTPIKQEVIASKSISVASPSPPTKKKIQTPSTPAKIQASKIPAKTQAPKAPLKKAAPIKHQPEKKKSPSKIPANLLHDLQESIAKIEEKDHKISPLEQKLTLPKWIPELKIDGESTEDEQLFVSTLIQCLQQSLQLPEVGAVKVQLTLKNDGTFVELNVLQSESQRNQEFLQQELKDLKYPVFTDSLKNEKEHTFIIQFCST